MKKAKQKITAKSAIKKQTEADKKKASAKIKQKAEAVSSLLSWYDNAEKKK